MWKQQLVIVIGLAVLCLPLLVRTPAVRRWWLVGMGAFTATAFVASLFGFPPTRHHASTTSLIGWAGLACIVASSHVWPGREGWRALNLTVPQIYQGYRDGTLRRPATWQNALQFLGLGLLVLWLWRRWSGLLP
jgi:hypothetical protein